ncbi:MAG: flagellar basal body-associated FliL family protein [Planctomycetota bacterium]
MSDEETTKDQAEKTRPMAVVLAVRLGMFVAVVLAGATGGFLAQALLCAGGPAVAQANEPAPEGGEPAGQDAAPSPLKAPPGKPSEELKYCEFEPVIVNINDGRLARFIRMAIILAIRPEDYDEAIKRIETFHPTLIDKLTVYLSGCTIEEVRGPKNLNRIRREILEMFSQILWPDEKPKIEEVLFKEFKIQ